MNVINTRKIWYGISGALVLLSIIVFATWGLKLGIEFTGGSLVQYKSPETVNVVELASKVGIENAQIVTTDDGAIVRAKEISAEARAKLLKEMKAVYPAAEEVRFEAVGPSIGAELRSKAVTAIILTLLLICAYVAWAFRKVTGRVQSWKYGIVTILIGLHDVIIPVGVFSVLGHYAGIEVTGAFIAGILTILGYSINDTIVVFDRVRENLMKTEGSVEEIIDRSIRQTAVRSINTSLTVVLSLLAIYLFGGDSTKSFALALMIGVIAGTYSSIFIAAPILVDWKKR